MNTLNKLLLKILAFGIVLMLSLQLNAEKPKLTVLEKVKTTKTTKMPEFTNIQNAEHLNSQWSDFGTIPYGSGMYFISSREREKYIFKYMNKDGYFFDVYYYEDDEGVKPYTAISTKLNKGLLCFDSTGRSMYYSRNSKKISGKNDRYTQLLFRVKRNKTWDKEELLPFSSIEYSCIHPSLSTDGSLLFFTSDMPGGFGGMDLYKVIVNKDGTFEKPINLGENINSAGNEVFPFVHSNGMLFFASDGHQGFGKLDNYLSFPDGENYCNPQNLGNNQNSENDDFAFYLDKEQETGYFSSDRKGGKGSDDIYSFIMSGTYNNNAFVKAIITSSSEYIPTSGILLKILDEEENVIEQLISDEQGEFELSLPIGSVYQVLLELDNSFVDMTYNMHINKTENEIEFSLKLDSSIVAEGEIRESIIQMTDNVIVTDLKNKESRSVLSTDGKFAFIIEAENEYSLKLKKDTFLTSELNISTVGMQAGEKIDLNALLELALVKEIVEETDHTKAIQLQALYFKFGNTEIIDETPLERVIKTMKENPDIKIELSAHTDCRGSNLFNQKLSSERAKVSTQYLIKKGIEESRISAKGYGETDLINKCDDGIKCSKEEHAKNRRTEFKVVRF